MIVLQKKIFSRTGGLKEIKRANLVGKDIFAEQKVLIKTYLKVVKFNEVCLEVNLFNKIISELKNDRKNSGSLKLRSFESLYMVVKKILSS